MKVQWQATAKKFAKYFVDKNKGNFGYEGANQSSIERENEFIVR